MLSVLFIKIFLSIVFATTAILKCINFKSFKSTIDQIGFSKRNSIFGGYLIIFLEFLISICILLNNPYQIAAIVLTLLLMLGFLTTTWIVVKSGKEIQCNCFGDFSSENFGISTVIRVLLISTLSIILAMNEAITIFESTIPDVINLIYISLGIIFMYLLISSYTELHKKLSR